MTLPQLLQNHKNIFYAFPLSRHLLLATIARLFLQARRSGIHRAPPLLLRTPPSLFGFQCRLHCERLLPRAAYARAPPLTLMLHRHEGVARSTFCSFRSSARSSADPRALTSSSHRASATSRARAALLWRHCIVLKLTTLCSVLIALVPLGLGHSHGRASEKLISVFFLELPACPFNCTVLSSLLA